MPNKAPDLDELKRLVNLAHQRQLTPEGEDLLKQAWSRVVDEAVADSKDNKSE